jgi:hypothetical protein
VPVLFQASGLGDEFSTLNYGLEDFGSVTHDAFARGLATNQGAPLTVLDNVDVGHGGNPDHPFISIWLDSILSQRLPATLPVSAPVSLPSWQNTCSWRGSYDVTTTTNAPWGSSGNPGVQMINNVIASSYLYTDPRPFTWLPSQNVANRWLAYANSGNAMATTEPFSQWAASYGLANDTTLTTEGDGVPILLKYFCGINPTVPMSASVRSNLPTQGVNTTTNPGTIYLTLTYNQSATVTGVSSHVQISSDLKTWKTVTPDLTLQSVSGNGDLTIVDGIKVTGAGNQFMRLVVTQP